MLTKKDWYWPSLGRVFVFVSLVIQTCCGIILTFYVNECMGSNDPEVRARLDDPRKEHEAVLLQCKKDEEFEASYKRATRWHRLSFCQRFMIGSAALVSIIGSFALFWFGDLLFNHVSLTSDFYAPLDAADPGLGGDLGNLPLFPQGHVFVAVYLLSLALYKGYTMVSSGLAREEFDKDHPRRESKESGKDTASNASAVSSAATFFDVRSDFSEPKWKDGKRESRIRMKTDRHSRRSASSFGSVLSEWDENDIDVEWPDDHRQM
jgi:hypothetical protein